MINAKELRLGNIVDYEATFHKITGLASEISSSVWLKGKETVYHVYDHIKPIPLTEDWLSKFGFAKEYENKYLLNKSVIDTYSGSFEFNHVVDSIKGRWVYSCIANIKYVHQLQNLYFALTGEELVIKNHSK